MTKKEVISLTVDKLKERNNLSPKEEKIITKKLVDEIVKCYELSIVDCVASNDRIRTPIGTFYPRLVKGRLNTFDGQTTIQRRRKTIGFRPSTLYKYLITDPDLLDD